MTEIIRPVSGAFNQTRAYDYGVSPTSELFNSVAKTIAASGVYNGFPITVTGPNQLTVAGGAVVTPDGLCVTLDGQQVFTVLSPTAATAYTMVLNHIYQKSLGGTQAQVLLYDDDLAVYNEGAILGWIQHPGGGVPFAQSMVLPAEPKNPSTILSELVGRELVAVGVLPNTMEVPGTFNILFDGIRPAYWLNTPCLEIYRGLGEVAPKNLQVVTTFPFIGSLPPLVLTVKFSGAFNAPLSFAVSDTTGQDYAATTTLSPGPSSWTEQQFQLSPLSSTVSYVWADGQPIYVTTTATLLPMQVALLAKISLRKFR